MILNSMMRMTSDSHAGRSRSSNSGQDDSCPEKGRNMEPIIMTAEELRTYLQSLPDNVILRVTVQEEGDESERAETV